MNRMLSVLLLVAASCAPSPRLGIVGGAQSPGLVWVSWGARTVTCNGRPCVLLDGGAATIISDPVVAGGYGLSQSGGTVFCEPVNAAATEDYVTAQIGNDGMPFVAAASPNTALIDGGFGDGGVPGVIVIATQSAQYIDLAITHLAAQNVALVCNINTVPH